MKEHEQVIKDCHIKMRKAVDEILDLLQEHEIKDNELVVPIFVFPAIMTGGAIAEGEELAVGADIYTVQQYGVKITASTYLDEGLYPEFFSD